VGFKKEETFLEANLKKEGYLILINRNFVKSD
jgi:hypothetical protein